MDLLDALLDHDYWATTELLAVCEPLIDAQLDQQFDIGHRSIRTTFEHTISESIEFWTRMMAGNPGPPEIIGNLSITELRDRFEIAHGKFSDFARCANAENRLDDIFVDHYDVRKSVGGTILAVIQHSEVHRSEIIHMLMRLGVADEIDIDIGAWDYERLNT